MIEKTSSSFGADYKLHEYIPYFQPQFNYETGVVIGAEVLARHVNPDGSIDGPNSFISLFEQNGFIYEMDKRIWEISCKNLSKWKAMGCPIESLSVNVSRKDLYHEDMPDYLKGLVAKYGISKKSLHLEITETAFSEDSDQLIKVLEGLRSDGFVIEMDDFGSGYSSLCFLKDLPVDILKMDSAFITSTDKSHRRGRIVTSIIQMAYAIDMQVIAEGVENKRQAEFLKSVGCLKMQGFYFGQPMDADRFADFLCNEAKYPENKEAKEIGVSGSLDFFDIDSQATLVFNSYVGGAAILSRGSNGKVAAIRINDKFFQLIGVGRKSYSSRQYDLVAGLSEETRQSFMDALDSTVSSGDEASCITCSKDIDGRGRDFWSYNKVRYLASKNDCQIFYLSLENVTEKVKLEDSNKQLIQTIEERDSIFMHAAEQVNMFFWKYDIRAKAIFPCFRCQMILGLPTRLDNYPESAIEMCIFPEGERYRQIIKKVDAGQDIDEIMLLTNEKLPFRVRYTVEKDENCKPTVAYATAIPVVS